MMISGSSPTVSPVYPPAERGNDARPQRSEPANARRLEDVELQELAELKARDREVRAHESAHQAVGGQYAGSISYVYERGPDGAQYAVGGEVSISTAPIQGDPQATIEKMRTVRAAALAPAEPSPQDRAVAAEAMQLMLQAQSELSSELGAPDEADASENADDGEQASRESRSAASAYQTVSGFGETDAVNEESSSRFMATA